MLGLVKITSIEQELTLPSGETVSYEIHAAPFNDRDGEFIGIIESFRDITVRNKSAKMFKEGHKELELRVSQRTEELLRNNKILGEQIVRRQKVEEILRSERDKFKGKDRNKKLAIKISTVEMVGTTYVRTSIKDFGIGIPSDIIDHVYDPFFSTKKSGEGTGLGLSISHGLVKKFKGFLRIKSNPGNYTNIMVDIPIYKGSQNNGQ